MFYHSFFTALLLMFTAILNSQNYKIVQYGTDYGLFDNMQNKMVIQPVFSSLEQYNDSVYLAKNFGNQYGILNNRGDTIIKFTREQIHYYDSLAWINSHFFEYPPTFNGQENTFHYAIDSNRCCIPYDYYPCLPRRCISYQRQPEYHKYIQEAIDTFDNGQLETALQILKKCQQEFPNEPYPYYIASLLLVDAPMFGSKPKNFKYQEYSEWIERNLNKADSLETNPLKKSRIKSLEYTYYRYCSRDIRRAIKTERNYLRGDYNLLNQQGTYLVLGYNYHQDHEFELGVSYGLKLIDFTSIIWREFVNIQLVGFSYHRNMASDIEKYKLSIAMNAPLQISLSAGVVAKGNQNDAFLNPEVGMPFFRTNLFLGYFFINKDSPLSFLRGFNFGIRTNVYLFGEKEY